MAHTERLTFLNLATPTTVFDLFGITVYDSNKVADYMTMQVRRHPANTWWRVRKMMDDHLSPAAQNRLGGILIFLCVASIIALDIAFFVLASEEISGNVSSYMWWGFGACCSSVALSVFVLWACMSAPCVGPAYWQTTGYYPGAGGMQQWVEEVRNTVHNLYPNATFRVVELKRNRMKGILDPLLEGKIEGLWYTFAIWDEKGKRVDL